MYYIFKTLVNMIIHLILNEHNYNSMIIHNIIYKYYNSMMGPLPGRPHLCTNISKSISNGGLYLTRTTPR